MAESSKKTPIRLRSLDSFSEDEAQEVIRKINATSFDGGSRKPPPDDPQSQRLDAKRINECLKHFNAFCNTLAAGILAAAAIVPFVKDPEAPLDANAAQWCLIALGSISSRTS